MNKKNELNSVKLFNAIGFQIGWFVCVSKSNLFGLTFSGAFLMLHLLSLHFYSDKFLLKKEIYWILAVITIGFLIETSFFSLKILQEDIQIRYLEYFITPPLWIIYLWMLFATTLRTSLLFLFSKPWLAYLAIAIMAPCSYFVGSHINTNVDINQPIILSLTIISAVWVFAFWVITHIKQFYFEDIFHGS